MARKQKALKDQSLKNIMARRQKALKDQSLKNIMVRKQKALKDQLPCEWNELREKKQYRSGHQENANYIAEVRQIQEFSKSQKNATQKNYNPG